MRTADQDRTMKNIYDSRRFLKDDVNYLALKACVWMYYFFVK